jgi:SAM-dependent methyltransferase
MSVDMPYIDAELAQLDAGSAPPAYLQHLHWGLFDDPDVVDDSPTRYVAAAQSMTERVVTAGRVVDGVTLLDVGCGFGGTLAHLRRRHQGCRLAGLNIDRRQLHWARELVGRGVGWVTGDGSRLPVASGSLDRVLAVECVFHFPSRKAFFAEAARVLRPGGVLALSDFLVARGAMSQVAENVTAFAVGGWYGRSTRPVTAAGYRRLAVANGFEVVTDDDVTPATLPTYAALRRIYLDAGMPEALPTLEGVESLARAGGWEYHVLAFRRTAAADVADGSVR